MDSIAWGVAAPVVGAAFAASLVEVVEAFTTVRGSEKPGWTLMIVTEFWWQPPSGEVFKTLQWAHVVAGRRADVVAWLKRQESRLEAPAS